MRNSLSVLIAFATLGGNPVLAQSQSTTVCGRVAAVSCTNSQSEVRIRLTERMRQITWTARIPSGQRSVFDTRLLTGLDDANVCVRTTVKPLGRDVMLLRPEDLVISDNSTPTGYQDNVVHGCDAEVEMPTVVRDVKASMTADAMRAKVNGVVLLRAVVDATGAVRDVRVVEELERSQDAACREALEKWIFKPARRGGAPVPMRISVEMHFTVR
jgi:TonB family protein